MNNKEFCILTNVMFDKCKSTLLKKGKDYSGMEDRLKNFKEVNAAFNAFALSKSDTPLNIALVMVCIKIDRICNLINEGCTPANESLEDSFIDLINYAVLMYALYKESIPGRVIPCNKIGD